MEEYDFEIQRIKKEILLKKPKDVLIQLPDGLKPFATKIADELSEVTNVYIWAGSCFGACDIPNVKVDMIIQFGHAEFKQ
ncbi:MAG: diphthamide synthesis protein [Nanoarchaeota archaeon]|nr:diphthamide synthesis protein [Nanoarchaeota archaeon]